jgi:hypothetical protein
MSPASNRHGAEARGCGGPEIGQSPQVKLVEGGRLTLVHISSKQQIEYDLLIETKTLTDHILSVIEPMSSFAGRWFYPGFSTSTQDIQSLRLRTGKSHFAPEVGREHDLAGYVIHQSRALFGPIRAQVRVGALGISVGHAEVGSVALSRLFLVSYFVLLNVPIVATSFPSAVKR